MAELEERAFDRQEKDQAGSVDQQLGNGLGRHRDRGARLHRRPRPGGRRACEGGRRRAAVPGVDLRPADPARRGRLPDLVAQQNLAKGVAARIPRCPPRQGKNRAEERSGR